MKKDSPNPGLSEAIKIRFSADQKAAISVLAKRAGLNDSTFVRQLMHHYLLANHQIYAKLFPAPDKTQQ